MLLLPVLAFWCLTLWGLASKKPILIYLFFASMSFGAFAAIPTQITGGLTLTPAPVVAAIIILKTALSKNGLKYYASAGFKIRRLGLLALFWLVALIVTIFMPRLFAGEVSVVPMRGILSTTELLGPSIQNISQLAYVTISVFTVFAVSKILKTREQRQIAYGAMGLGAIVLVVTGLLDFLTQYIPIAPLLDPFRTATYALLTDVEVLGGKRVVGLTPEASSFGSLCLYFLSGLFFIRRVIDDDSLKKTYTPILIVFLALFIYLSKSSSAMVGLFILGVVLLYEWVHRALVIGKKDYRKAGVVTDLAVLYFSVLIIMFIYILSPALFDPIIELVDRMILQKSSSASFEERGMWRSTALEALQATYGFGVGLGSARASSSLVATFCTTGVAGGFLFYLFVIKSMVVVNDREHKKVVVAFRWFYVPIFVVGLVVGSANFGLYLAFWLGLLDSYCRGETSSLRV